MTTKVMRPKESLSTDELEKIRREVQEMPHDVTTTLVPKAPVTTVALNQIKQQLRKLHERLQKSDGERMDVVGSIVAVIPAFETEGDIDKTIESLLVQSRQLEQIVVVVNGPGRINTAYDVALPYAVYFDNVIVVRLNEPGKVNALNWAYRHHVREGEFDFMIGVDADVVCDPDMVCHLEADVLKYHDALGVKACYSFKTPSIVKRGGRGIIYGQRLEFAMTETKQQLRGGKTEILGGQSTIFRTSALHTVAQKSVGGMPWNPESKVEDAELTRVASRFGFTARSSSTARAWTGLMESPYAWHKQRRKWQDGHLEDMTKEFHPVQDARRWMQQCVLGWNVLIRVMFGALMVSGVLLDRYVFSPIWLVPIGLSMLQSLLIAIKLPNRSLGEVVRSVAFVPGEIYYLRTLSVWIESVIATLLNIKKDGWKRQYAAEAGRKRASISGWIVLSLALLVPIVALFGCARFMSAATVSFVFSIGWNILTAMTVLSIASMMVLILRILRRWRTLAP